MENRTISINNKIISYKIAGEGECVILLHGFGEDSNVWQDQAYFLKSNYTVIMPDVPGSGYSELTDDVSMEAIAAVVKEILDSEDIEKVVLIGHSMGGYATLAFAEKYSEMLKGFGLFHSLATADNDEKKIVRRKGIDFIKKYGAKTFLEMQPGNLFAEQTRDNNPSVINQFLKSYQPFSNKSLIEYYEAMIARPDRTHVLKDSKVPVLFVAGEKDAIIPMDAVVKQIPLVSISNVHILSNSGHMGMLEEPNEANKAIEDFLLQVNGYTAAI